MHVPKSSRLSSTAQKPMNSMIVSNFRQDLPSVVLRDEPIFSRVQGFESGYAQPLSSPPKPCVANANSDFDAYWQGYLPAHTSTRLARNHFQFVEPYYNIGIRGTF